MNKSQISKQILAKMPGFQNKENFFYHDSFEHILNGFFCEITPNGAYLWRFIFPLFDNFECLSLLYSFRLKSKGYISFNEVPREDLAEEFLSRVQHLVAEASQRLTLEQFVNFFDERPSLLANAHAEMSYGYAMVLMGEKEKALKHLLKASKDVSEPYSADCLLVFGLAEIDMHSARNKVLEFERANKSKLGVCKEF